MNKILKKTVIASAIATVAAGGFMANDAQAKGGKEKCYGVAKAGKNDCAGGKNSCSGSKMKKSNKNNCAAHKAARLSCAGSSTKNFQKNAYLVLPKGLCNKLAGGSTHAGM